MDIQRKRKERSLHFLQTTDIQSRKKEEHAKKNVKNPSVLSSNIKRMPAMKNVKMVIVDVSQEPSDDEEDPNLNPVCSKCGGTSIHAELQVSEGIMGALVVC
jgi:hypothetical protein